MISYIPLLLASLPCTLASVHLTEENCFTPGRCTSAIMVAEWSVNVENPQVINITLNLA